MKVFFGERNYSYKKVNKRVSNIYWRWSKRHLAHYIKIVNIAQYFAGVATKQTNKSSESDVPPRRRFSRYVCSSLLFRFGLLQFRLQLENCGHPSVLTKFHCFFPKNKYYYYTQIGVSNCPQEAKQLKQWTSRMWNTLFKASLFAQNLTILG